MGNTVFCGIWTRRICIWEDGQEVDMETNTEGTNVRRDGQEKVREESDGQGRTRGGRDGVHGKCKYSGHNGHHR